LSDDTNAPILNVESPDDGTETAEEKIEVYGTASDDSGFVFVKVNGKFAGTTNWFKKVSLSEGTNLITITAFDVASNVTEEIRTVIYAENSVEDTEAPVIDEVDPEDGYETYFPKVRMVIQASDNVKVESVSVNGNDAKFSRYGWLYVADLALGNNSMEIIAADAAGNQSTKNVVYIRQETNVCELVIVTTNLHSAVVSNVYKSTLRARGGVKPYKWSLIEGEIPENFMLLENGDIIGIAAETGTYDFKAQVVDMDDSVAISMPLQIVVKECGKRSQFITKTLVDAMRKHAYSTKILLKGDDSNCEWKFSAESDLPVGMKLTNDGCLEGTPEESGIYEMKIKAESKTETIINIVSLEVADAEKDTLSVEKIEGMKIMVNWRKRLRNGTNNCDRLMLRMRLMCGEDFCLTNKDFAVNIGNFAVPLEVKEYKKNGTVAKFENKYQSREELRISGKAKLDDAGNLHMMVNIKNADVSEMLNIRNGNCRGLEEQLPVEIIAGNETAHSVLQMRLNSRENKKSVMKLQK
jgi:hypothetical protein